MSPERTEQASTKKHMERCAVSSASRERQVRATRGPWRTMRRGE